MGRTHSKSKRADFFCRARLFEDAVLGVRVRLEDLRAVFLRVVEAFREDVFALLPVFFEVRVFLLVILFNKFSCTISACLEPDYSTNGLITNPTSSRGSLIKVEVQYCCNAKDVKYSHIEKSK